MALWSEEYLDGVGRYYDPATGQFLSVDPMVQQTLEAYLYTGEDPVNAVDPDGLGGQGVGEVVPGGIDVGNGRILPTEGEFPYKPPKGTAPLAERSPTEKGAFRGASGSNWEWAAQQHGGPHWDVTMPRNGGYLNVAPNGKILSDKRNSAIAVMPPTPPMWTPNWPTPELPSLQIPPVTPVEGAAAGGGALTLIGICILLAL